MCIVVIDHSGAKFGRRAPDYLFRGHTCRFDEGSLRPVAPEETDRETSIKQIRSDSALLVTSREQFHAGSVEPNVTLWIAKVDSAKVHPWLPVLSVVNFLAQSLRKA